MTFLTLLVVLTQTVSVGVVDEPMVLANGTRLMPGDRVLAIHDSTHPWLAFLPSGEFRPIDSSKIIIAGEWHPSNFDFGKRPDVESGAWSEPERQSRRVPWRSGDRRIYFDPARSSGFSYRDSSFWGRLLPGSADGWFPLTHRQVLSSISDNDSSTVRAMLDMADAMRRGRSRLWIHEPPDSVQRRKALRLYELTFEASRRHGYREIAADAILTLVTTDLERRDTTMALTRLRRAAKEFVGVKSKFGRADAFATWQMMELARGQKQTARVNSLARRIVVAYPDEAGMYASRSVWFDLDAADRLLQAMAGDESEGIAAAQFLLKSASVAVRYRGYGGLARIHAQRSDQVGALAAARKALSLPHATKWQVHAPLSDDRRMPPAWHDFKNEFMDSIDVWLPFDDLLQLYGSACVSGDTMASRDAARWLGKQIELGRTPPRAGILDQVGPRGGPDEFRRALLGSITSTPRVRTVVECTLYTRIPRGFWQKPRLVATQVLPNSCLVQPSVWLDGLIRVSTSDGSSGWISARALQGAVSVWDMPAAEMAEPQALADIDGDGVKDLGLGAADLLDGKGLTVVRPPDRKYGWLTGFFRHEWVELRQDTLWLRGVGADTVPKALPTARKTKKGSCSPGSCFYFVAMPGPSDSFAYVSAVRERGAIWTSPISVRKDYAVGVHQIDSVLVVLQEKGMWLLSAANGALRGQVAARIYLKSWRGVFFNRSGYAMAKGDSVIFRNYSGSESIGVAMAKSDVKFFPPFAASLESDVWGVGNFGQPLSPVASDAVPVIRYVHRHDGESWRYDVTMHLISLQDGRELAAIPISESSADCRYDEHGVYVSDDSSFRAVTWEGTPLPVVDLPYLSFPIWDGDRIVSYYSRPMGMMLEAGAASRLADAVRPLRSRWPAMDNPRGSGE